MGVRIALRIRRKRAGLVGPVDGPPYLLRGEGEIVGALFSVYSQWRIHNRSGNFRLIPFGNKLN